MYLTYWRLKEEPFKNGLEERFLYPAPQHQEGVARLLYAARQHKQGALLTGAFGTGKSLVRKVFVSKLDTVGRFTVALVESPLDGQEMMMRDIFAQLSGTSEPAAGGVTVSGMRALLEERRSQGFHNLVIVEEAQLLDRPDRLDPFRVLMNLTDASGQLLLTLVLIGQNGIRDVLKTCPGLRQRLPVQWTIGPLSADQTRQYLNHRLSMAGGGGWMMDDGAAAALHHHCGGLPRMLNNLADMALYLGMMEQAVHVDAAMVERVAADWHGMDVPGAREDDA